MQGRGTFRKKKNQLPICAAAVNHRTVCCVRPAAEVRRIRTVVPQALMGVEHLVAAQREPKKPLAFMGVTGCRLEMLFLAPEERGRGLGRRLVQYGVRQYGLREVTVNEQNPQAVGFYEHLGFTVYQRTACDEAGDPYPLLYLRLA